MRRFLFFLLLLTAMTINAQKYYGYVSDPDGYTNIRSGASSKASIVRTYASGDYLYYTPVKNGWSKVYSGTSSSTFMGYMHTSRIVRVDPNRNYYEELDDTPNLSQGYIVDPSDKYVNVRTGPGSNYSICTHLYVGTFVYYERGSKWVRVYDEGMNFLGYVARSRIK